MADSEQEQGERHAEIEKEIRLYLRDEPTIWRLSDWIGVADELLTTIRTLQTENTRYRGALEEVENYEIVWSEGAGENVERIQSIARAALTEAQKGE